MNLMNAPRFRAVDALTGQIADPPTYPSLCVVCGISAWFTNRVERLRFDLKHIHPGVD